MPNLFDSNPRLQLQAEKGNEKDDVSLCLISVSDEEHCVLVSSHLTMTFSTAVSSHLEHYDIGFLLLSLLHRRGRLPDMFTFARVRFALKKRKKK